jgi:pimeloyl-ACP methyl ester carboxylesterase
MLNHMKLYKNSFLLQELPKEIECRPVTLVTEQDVPTRAVLYWRAGTRPRVGVHLLHPRADQSQNYSIPLMAMAGYAVLGQAPSSVNMDANTEHERILLDFAAGMRFLRDEVGCDELIMLGNSGGSSLAAMYQWQAATAPPDRLTTTAAGDPFDLNRFELPPGDGLAIIGGHEGEGKVLLKFIDPAVVDEADPIATDPELDMYDPINGFRMPPESSSYSEDFLERYLAGQHRRVHRLDEIARHMVRDQRAARDLVGTASDLDDKTRLMLERRAIRPSSMLVYRTAAYPATLDMSIEPDGRLVGSYVSQQPQIENYVPVHRSRYVTPRAWLSTWSGLSSRANTGPCLEHVSIPMIMVHYSGDQGVRLSEAKALFDGCASDDKEYVVIPAADHYGRTIQDDGTLGRQTTDGTRAIVDWSTAHFKP